MAAIYWTSADLLAHKYRAISKSFIIDLVSPLKKKVLSKLRKAKPDSMNLLQVLGPSHRILSMEAKGIKVIHNEQLIKH